MTLFNLSNRLATNLRTVVNRTTTTRAASRRRTTTTVVVDSDTQDRFEEDLIKSQIPDEPLATTVSFVGLLGEDKQEESTALINHTFLNRITDFVDIATNEDTDIVITPVSAPPPAPTLTPVPAAVTEEEVPPEPSENQIPLMENESIQPTAGVPASPLIDTLLSSPTLFGETILGVFMEDFDKPRMISILEDNIDSFGHPRDSVLFVSRINTNKFKEIKYEILRKAIFFENNYRKIAEISGDKIVIEEKYLNWVKNNLKLNEKKMFSFVDTNLEKHQVYAYKIRAECTELSEGESRIDRSTVIDLVISTNQEPLTNILLTGDINIGTE